MSLHSLIISGVTHESSGTLPEPVYRELLSSDELSGKLQELIISARIESLIIFLNDVRSEL